jgi:hypothetical protein
MEAARPDALVRDDRVAARAADRLVARESLGDVHDVGLRAAVEDVPAGSPPREPARRDDRSGA